MFITDHDQYYQLSPYRSVMWSLLPIAINVSVIVIRRIQKRNQSQSLPPILMGFPSLKPS